MNCCDDFGQCQQGHGCPARTTPAQCLKAGFCQSRKDCHCERIVTEDRMGTREALAIAVVCCVLFLGLAGYVISLYLP